MLESGPSLLLLDFFGTLVDYSATGAGQQFERTLAFLRLLGRAFDRTEFLDAWSTVFAELDARSAVNLREFSIADVSATFLAACLARTPKAAEVEQFADTYVEEWDLGVHYPDGIADLVQTLAKRHQLAIVTNSHDESLVPAHLERMGIAEYFGAVVISVAVGWRKPHPAIYSTALSRLGVEPAQALFVGDTYDADYLGPRAAGIPALLIDPTAKYPIPDDHRLKSLFDLASK